MVTFNTFIERLNEKYPDNKYDFSLVDKDNFLMTKHITVICPIHGEFSITPNYFLSKQNKDEACPKCKKESIRLKRCKEFIDKVISIHGNKYDYSKVWDEFETMEKYVTIICPVHGEFKIRPLNLIKENTMGCPQCYKEEQSRIYLKTTEQYIKECIEVHENRYDYSKVVYTGKENKVIIGCPKHGYFEQIAKVHLNGHGCPKCAVEYKNQLSRLSQDEFIRRSKEAHPDRKYDYSHVEYINETTPVLIGCPVHGLVSILPVNHMRGAICPKCAIEEQAFKRRSNTEEFIQKAIMVHGDRYDYSLVEYTKSSEEVTIICPEHGQFKQLPQVHLSGHGCPLCNNSSNGEIRIERYLKEHNIDYEYQYRIYNLTSTSNNKRFIVDFYIRSLNLFIEYNGRQHYEMPEFWGGNRSFEEQQQRDKGLRETANIMGINLLEIKYTDFRKITEILDSVFKVS